MARLTSVIPEFTVFLSSPGDVFAERRIVERAIQEINEDPGWKNQCVLTLLAYEKNAPSQMGKSAQRVVDDFMRKACEADIVVCIFCNRMGTPTVDNATGTEYSSGTHYEFDSAYQAYKRSGGVAPRIMLYLGSRSLSPDPSDDDLEQFTKVRNFKKNIERGEYEGLYYKYSELKELEVFVRNHLRKHLEQLLASTQIPLGAWLVAPGPMPGLRIYLGRLAETYRWLELQGIREAGALRIELNKVYVALKAEPESEYDRQQAANLHDLEVRESAGVGSTDVIPEDILEKHDSDNVRRTFRPGREEARRSAIIEVRTLGDAFRQHRQIVILGGPGSGKTTLGRWLVLQLACALLRELDAGTPQKVEVPISQIDPDASPLDEGLVDLGPARLPIFLRLAHFARELAERERQQQPSRALIDYLGHDPDSCSLTDGFDPDARNALFRSLLDTRRAVVVLDGLDELTETNRRTVVLKIQDFVEEYTSPRGVDEAVEPPWKCGGNQVVVTSRYVGYKAAPVQAGCVHFGIQPMKRSAVERFAHAWTDAVNAELAAEGRAGVVAERLIAEIYNDARPAVRELATNPLLVTILATVYWRDGQLPDQRAGVYDRVVENLLRIWLNREECRAHDLTREQLLAALEPLAADMQENASNGLISLDRIGELVEGPLAYLSGMTPDDRRFRPIRDALLETIRKHVGLLAEQGKGNYSFFHRTFQEFLAARHLLAHRPSAAAKIGDRLDDPLWREPLLLALGFVMIDPQLGPEARNRLLTEILAADGPNALIPRAAMLLVAALPDMRNTPAEVVGQTAMRLLTSYAISLEHDQVGGLREQIEQAFVRLREGQQRDTVARQIGECLRRPTSGRDLAGAAATMLRRIDWFTTPLVESMLLAVHRDRADLDWPIHRALLAALGLRPAALPWLAPAPALDIPRLLQAHLPMRKFLEARPELVDLARGDADWLCLLVALYGGLGHLQLLERVERHQRWCVQSARIVAETVPVSLPVDDPELESPPPIPAVEFSPQDIVHDLADADLSRLIQRHLGARKPACELVDVFRQRWEASRNPAGGAEALVALAALGEDILPLLQAGLAQVERQPAAHAALDRFGWLSALLREPLLRATQVAVRTIPAGAPEQHQLDLLRTALTVQMASGGSPLPVSDRIPEYRYVTASTPSVRDALEAEFWAYLLSGTVGDGNESALFASLAGRVTRPVDCLIRSWSLLPEARNHLAARRLPWPQPILAPRLDSAADRYLAMLDEMTCVPQEYLRVAGHMLGRCRPFLDKYPALAWETLAVCWGLGEEFLKGFRQAVLGETIQGPSPGPSLGVGQYERAFRGLSKLHGEEWEAASELHKTEADVFACLLPDELSDHNPRLPSRLELLIRISSITDPYLRFRAWWRFQQAIAREDESMEVDVTGLLMQIPDPLKQVCAFEWILMTIPMVDIGLMDHIGLLEPILRVLAQIADPENRARAQGRLAFFAVEHMESLLQGAVESVHSIANPVRKAETIREFRAAWGRTAEVAEALDTVARTIPDPWVRDKALGRTSRLIQAYRHQDSASELIWRLPPDTAIADRVYRRPQPAGWLPWCLMYLSATADEVESTGPSRTSAGGDLHWDRLLGAERPAAIAALVATGEEGGLRVTAREVFVLDRVVQAGQAADLDGLWPYLERPDPGAMGAVTRWSARLDRAGYWSALVQAERGRLAPDIVASVIDLLASSTDRLNLRAALALHGPTPTTQNRKRRWSVRRVGAETVDVLARSAIQNMNLLAVQTSLSWVKHDLHHDDGEALASWLEQTVSGGRESAAAWVLKSLESIQSNLVRPLLLALQSGPPDLQAPLLIGLAQLAYSCPEFQKSAGDLHVAVAAVPLEVRAGLRILSNGPTALLEIVKKTVEETSPEDRLPHARRLLDSQLSWLDESCLSSASDCLTRLKAIGSGLYVELGDPRLGGRSYWSRADKVAAPLSTNSGVLPLLLAWLETVDATADPNGYAHHLLTATEAVARFSPDTFARIAAPEFWEPILTEWAQFGEHWAARMAAVRLLGRLRRVTDRVALALRSAMNDVSFVQQAAYSSVSEFRRIEGDILPELFQLIDGPSAGVAAATIRLLVSVAQAEVTPSDRRRVLGCLEQSATRSSVARPVYLMEEYNGSMSVRFVDRLDRILYRAIFEVSGF